MVHFKKWILFFFFLAVFLILLVAGFNYLIDPYGLNQKYEFAFNRHKLPNVHITITYKLNKIIEGGYKNLMLGSSRIGVIDPEVVSEYLGEKTFNLSILGSRTIEHYETLLYALKFNSVKNVIYAVDFFALNGKRGLSQEYKQKRPKILSYSKVLTPAFYFSRDTLLNSFKTVWKNIQYGVQDKYFDYFFLDNGMLDYQNYTYTDNQDIYVFDKARHLSLNEYLQEGGFYKPFEFSADYLENIRKIKYLCEKNKIKLYVYVSPIYIDLFYTIYQLGLGKEFERFKRELASITTYLDFTGENPVTVNPEYYWDVSHLRTETSKIILARLFKDRTTMVPFGFGTWVTKKNVKRHNRALRKQVKPINLKEISIDQ